VRGAAPRRDHPRRAAGRLSRARGRAAGHGDRSVIAEAIEAGGSTLRDYARPDGELGYFAARFTVYDREGEACRCGAPVRRSSRAAVRLSIARVPALAAALTRIGPRCRGAAISARGLRPPAPLFHGPPRDYSMANTPQAKKRIRRNANREAINHARISRIRTFIKQVESALAAGKKDEAAEALKGTAGARSRSRSRRASQEHRIAEIVAPVQAGCRAGLTRVHKNGFQMGRSGCSGGPFRFATFKKGRNSRDSRDYRKVNFEKARNSAVSASFRQFSLSSRFISLCEKTGLESCRRGFQKHLPRRESAPGAREKETVGRATRIAGNGSFCLGARG
jgi:small subunit ribosomal protein S20